MELRGIGTTRQRRPVGTITPTTLENLVKTSITIDPIVGSRSNFFDEFSEAVFNGVAWNGYDTPTTSGRGQCTGSAREPGQMVLNYRSDRWIALNFFHNFPEVVFNGVARNQYDTPMVSDRGHSIDNAREPGQKVLN